MDYEAEVVSADTGLPVDTQVAEPQPEVKEEVAEVETEETTPEPTKEETPTEENLVELPDGRKLPPKEAEAEYRNLYSEFTRKSQILAKYEKGDNSKITNTNETTEKEEWIPQTWEEVKKESIREMRAEMEKERQAETETRKKNEEYVVGQLAELKKENPTLNETQLFNHALKYNFTDLKLAHYNWKDMQSSIKKATEMTVANLQKRNADPINGGSQGGTISDGDVYDPSARSISLVDYLHSLK